MSTGTALMNRVTRTLSEFGATVFRNTTAKAWAGKSFALRPGDVYRAHGGERVVLNAYPIQAGLCVGSSDVIGMVPVVITPAMVGKQVAVFAGWEVKDGEGRATKDQKNFVNHIVATGGIGVVVRSEAEAIEAITAYLKG
jgi:hypothetical protein